jgi:hypothetical protein
MGIDPKSCSFDQIASQLIKLSEFSMSEAKNAYSALLLLPGFDQLRFNNLLHPFKRLWSASNQKYQGFWDAKQLLIKLSITKLNKENIQKFRDRLIIIWRLFHLTRSIDLARLYRTISRTGDRYYVLMQRKKQRLPSWHEVIALEDNDISPLHLLLLYVQLTASMGRPGGPVFLAFKSPYKPLSSDRVGSITKNLLTSYGIPN